MGLHVEFGPADDTANGIEYPDSWMVCLNHVRGPDCVVPGFHRRIDAEIAMRALLNTDIDWDLPASELLEQWKALGGWKAVKKVACEHLQW